MTEIKWDEVGARRYETGVDRGVLYLPAGTAVPWNGLTAITENVERDVKSYYIDGVKYLDQQVPDAYSAKLEALTYPDEFDELLGVSEFGPGVFLHDQPGKSFGLSYRTLVGNDVEGTEFGYKLHILYNLTASASGTAMSTLGDTVSPATFSWSLTGVPPAMSGARPTCHISLHSAGIDPGLLSTIEDLLYGTATVDPALPDLVALLALVEGFYA
jgi:hypothetical protein